jgi:hypothetical protein
MDTCKMQVMHKFVLVYFLTYIQPPMAHLKITFWRRKKN